MKFATTLAFQVLGTVLLAAGTALPVWAVYESAVLSQGPIGYWRLNETTVPVPAAAAANLGSLGGGANGTYNNYPTRGWPGPFAGSLGLKFDGVSQTVSAPYAAELNPAVFTIEAWVNPATAKPVGNLGCLAASMHSESPRSGWLIYQSGGTDDTTAPGWQLRLYAQNESTTSLRLLVTNNVTPGTWYHLVYTFDGTVAKGYLNGELANQGPAAGYVPNTDAIFSVGARSDTLFPWAGQSAEVAYYDAILTGEQIKAHYDTASTNAAGYQGLITANAPLVYYRFREPADPVAVNLGTIGGVSDGFYVYNAKPGVTGPQPPALQGFDAGNKAAGFDGVGGGVVQIPALNLGANTVTITTWINAKGAQVAGTGLVFSRDNNGTIAGLNIDAVNGGLGLGYTWNGDANTYNWSPTTDGGLPNLPDSQWAFAALVVSPDQAVVYLGDPSNASSFAGATNLIAHPVQSFSRPTLFGADVGFSKPRVLNGALDEVAIFNRSLSAGEVFTQFATAVGGIAPKIFTDLKASPAPVVGNPLVLTIDAGGTQPLTYMWRRAGGGIVTTTSAILTIASATVGDGGTYDVTITNSSGTVTSAQVAVVIDQATPPDISQLPGFQDRTLYPGGTLSLGVVATGGGLKYQWYKDSALIALATTSTYRLPSVTNIDAGSYTVTVTNSLGSVSAGPVVITIPSVVAGSYEALVIGSAPEAWWRLDEAAGSAQILDGMGRHDGSYESLNSTVPPVALGTVGAIAGNTNTAASFSPANQGLGVIPYSPDLNPGLLTYEGWAKTTVLNNLGLVPFSSNYGNTGFWWQTIPAGFWSPASSGGYYDVYGNGNTASPMTSGAWTHLVMSYDSTRVSGGTHFPWKFYVNGVTDGFAYVGPGANSGGPFIIGGRGVDVNTLADRFFDGQVDEVAVYKRLLLESEIMAHFQARFGSVTPPHFIGAFLPQTVTIGRSLSYTTVVQGSVPITLQWCKDGFPISGAATASLEIATTAVSNTGTYTLWATNVAGVSSQSVVVTVIEAVNYANATNGLVLHLRFDGDVTDSSGRNNNGNQVGSPAFVTGPIGSQALQYATETDGAATPAVTNASYVALGTPADLNFGSATSFTIGLWVKLPAAYDGGDLPFIGREIGSITSPGWGLSPTYGGGGWQWCLNDGVSPGLSITNNVDVNGEFGSLNDGGWHNFVLTVDRTAKVANSYLDGVLMVSRDITPLGSVDTGAPVTIGQDPTGRYPESGTATLDDVGIWRQVLTPLEVAQIYSAGTTSGRSFDTVGPANATITVIRSGSSLTLFWTTGTLLQSDTLGANAAWEPVPGASAPSYTFTPGTGNKFYRVQL